MSWENNYETGAQRVKRRLKETLTGREKLANWWEYHKIHVAVVVVLLLFVLYFAMQDRSILDADYTVAWVSGQMLDDETAEDISAKLAQYGQDLDGNGAVRVNIHQIKLDLRLVIERCGTEGQQKYGELLALNSDLEVGQSGIFLTDDPASLQAYTGAFLYRNGTMPENGPLDWQNMVISWEQEGVGTVYAGLRGCWTGRRVAWAWIKSHIRRTAVPKRKRPSLTVTPQSIRLPTWEISGSVVLVYGAS